MLRLDSFPLNDDEGVARWRELESQSEIRSPFAALDVVRAIGNASRKVAQLHLASADGVDQAAIATFHTRIGPFRKKSHPALSYYSPILLRHRPSDAVVHSGTDCLTVLLEALAARGLTPRLQLPPAATDVRPARQFGYGASVYYTYLLDLEAAGAENWSTSTRRMYRRSIADYRFEEGTESPALVLRLAAQSYLRNAKRPPFRTERLAREMERLRSSGQVRLFFVRETSGAVTGGLIVLVSGRDACYWIAGSEPGPSMTVLVGRALEELQASGISTFDFLGANTASIAEFKRRFGPTLTPFYHCQS